MTIHLLDGPATPVQMKDMMEEFGEYIKFAVDIERGVAAGGGNLHADCESMLLDSGSRQADIWGADYIPEENHVRCEAMINLAPSKGNPSMLIQNSETRAEVEAVLRRLIPT